MTTRADGIRRIGTANTTIATASIAGVVGLGAMLAQHGTHHAAATVPTAVTSGSAATSSSAAASTSSTSSDDTTTDDTTTTVSATPAVTVPQSTSGTVQHAVTSGS